MTVEIITPETLTWEQVKQWDGGTMRKYMGVPSMRAAIQRVVSSQQLADIEAMQTKLENELTSTTPAPVADAPVVEPVVVPEVQIPTPEPKKIVVDYQVKDEEGNPIGRPTHLEAASEEEMRSKMIEAHVQATRAFHRLKKQKVQSLRDVNVQPAAAVATPELTDAEILAVLKDLRSEDPKVQLQAHRKLNAAEISKAKAEADAVAANEAELARQKGVSYQFLMNHKNDFNNCQANVDLMKDYFQTNELPWTLDNLEIAFHALEDQLAPVAGPTVALPPANPAPVVQPTATAAAPVVQPVPTVPVVPTPPANPVPVQARPAFNGGIVPGQNSAPRPVTKSSGLTMAEITSWDGPTMRAKMRNPQIRAQIEATIAEARSKK